MKSYNQLRKKFVVNLCGEKSPSTMLTLDHEKEEAFVGNTQISYNDGVDFLLDIYDIIKEIAPEIAKEISKDNL